MKKITLFIAVLALFCGITYGQVPKQAEPATTPVNPSTSPTVSSPTQANPTEAPSNPSYSQGKTSPNSSNSSNNAVSPVPTPAPAAAPTPTPAPTPAPTPTPTPRQTNRQTSRSQDRGSHAIGGLLLGYNFSDSPSRFAFQYDFGGKSSGPLFWEVGVGAARSKYSTTVLNNDYETISWGLRVPAYLGVLIGKEDGFSVSVRGGAMFNYLLTSKTNGEANNLSGIDRTAINGSVRVCVWHFFAEYEFPFTSVQDGVWLFGICGPF